MNRAGPFLFATGIENSYPTIQQGRVRVDEMEKCRHYEHWRLDFRRVEESGIQYLRYGPPLYRTFVDRGRYDWAFQRAVVRVSSGQRHDAERVPLPHGRPDGGLLRNGERLLRDQ